MFSIPIFIAIYAGFTHAFEADHLLAVSNIVSQRNNIKTSVKDGIYWGLGHASTIFIIGLLMIAFNAGIPLGSFYYFEATVGAMLIALAVYRLMKFFSAKKIVIHGHPYDKAGGQHKHLHLHIKYQKHNHPHALAYGIGLIHGLAGSGALIVVAMSQIKGAKDGLLYLVIFGLGGIGGMMLASGLFSLPFSKRIMNGYSLQAFLIIISSLLCMIYGGKLIYENLLV